MSGSLRDVNRQFYDALWQDARLVPPERFNTWALVQSLLPGAARRLEVAPGLRPRLPIAGTHMVDISVPALAQLRRRGAHTALAAIGGLPFPDGSFDLLCACDVVEHVDDDRAALAELSRVAAPGAVLLLSVPLHQAFWTGFDEIVGHRRRYEPAALAGTLAMHGFEVTVSAAHGMRPRNSRLVALGMGFLRRERGRAMWWYNRVVPLAARMQPRLRLVQGMADLSQAAAVLLVCRRMPTNPDPAE